MISCEELIATQSHDRVQAGPQEIYLGRSGTSLSETYAVRIEVISVHFRTNIDHHNLYCIPITVVYANKAKRKGLLTAFVKNRRKKTRAPAR